MDPLTKNEYRLHISGIRPDSHSADDIIRRFSSFGDLLPGQSGNLVDGLGTDPSGRPQDYAFITLMSTEREFRKCISILSGSMWKGRKLHVAKAKPTYFERMRLEREQLARPQPKTDKERKRKRWASALHGHRFELVTAENVAQHSGWVLDKKDQTPLFLLQTRPPHPLPEALDRQKNTPWSRIVYKQREKYDEEGNKLPPRSLTRIRRRVIDSRRYGRKKTLLDNMPSTVTLSSTGMWVCEESDDARATWVFMDRSGKVLSQEVVTLGRKSTYTDRFSTLLDHIEEEQTPVEEEVVVADDPEEVTFTRKRLRSVSPPKFVPVGTHSLLYNEEDTFALLEASRSEEEKANALADERKAQLQIALSFMKKDDKETSTKVVSFEDDEEPLLHESLRLRGGGREKKKSGVESEDKDKEESSTESGDEDEESQDDESSSSSEDSSDDDDSDSSEDEDESSANIEKPTSVSTAKPPANDFTFLKNTETSTAGFSLLGDMELELENEEELDEERKRHAVSIAPVEERIPMRPLRVQPKGGAHTQASTAEPQSEFFVLGRDNLSFIERAARSFEREADIEKIEEYHSKLRESLQGYGRKRHRESARNAKKGRKLGRH